MIDLYNSSKRACTVCPRNHAKTTQARKYILHQILYDKTKYTVLLGSSEDMAGQSLRWIRDQLIENDKLVEIYGSLYNKNKWADTEFQTSTKIKVSAKGAGQKIRGSNEKGRPDLIYADDLEDDEEVKSKDRRIKLRQWLLKAVLPALSKRGRFIYTGTILHVDSLLKNVSRNKVRDATPWKVLVYKAINVDEKGREFALWSAHISLKELRALREADPETFAQEYQNNPTSGSMAVFNREEFEYFDDYEIRKDEATRDFYIREKLVHTMLSTDLAVSEKEGADYTVLMVTGMDENENLYVIDYERFRSSDPYEQIELIFDMCRKWSIKIVTMEAVAFQKTFKRIFEHEMNKRAFYLEIQEMVRQSIRKIFRIKSLKGPIRAGKIFWKRNHYDLEDELEQVSSTALGTHDDVIDCLADAWEVQIEIHEDMIEKPTPVNTVEWAIEQGLLPTIQEEEEARMYGYVLR